MIFNYTWFIQCLQFDGSNSIYFWIHIILFLLVSKIVLLSSLPSF